MPRTITPDSRRSPRFSGISTFARFPLLDQVKPECRPLDWIIYGIPFDGGTTYRPGARFGPRAIREESQYVKPFHLEYGLSLTEALSIADGADAPVRPYDCRENAQSAGEFGASLPDAKTARLLALGGDHSIALPNLRATHQRRGKGARPLALIHIDAHFDTIDQVWDEKYGHASPFIRAAEEGLIDPARMISIGIRGPLTSSQDLDYSKKHGVTLVTTDGLRKDGLRAMDSFAKRIGEDEVYLSFDIDVVDPAFAPGTGTPCIGGLSSAEVIGLLRHLGAATGRPPNIVGADVVEVLPDRDVGGITALLAAHVAFEILCLSALRTRQAT